ncbi:hypothetical protein JCM10369A_44120 [Nocardioides pyridinolyticus]
MFRWSSNCAASRWTSASLEHKIYYKYDGAVPDALRRELKEAEQTANELDSRMERLHRELHG